MISRAGKLFGTSVSARAYAKVNLRLKITGRRDDGYHLLSMLNAEISLFDEIEVAFDTQSGVALQVEGSAEDHTLSDPKLNLATRAASAYLARVALGAGVTVRLRKSIPLGAGLGGGSADAAAVLRVLNSACVAAELPSLTPPELLQLGLSLGADVPYFLSGGLAWVQGVGEEVFGLPRSALDEMPCFLFLPKTSISTPQLYARYREAFPRISADADLRMQDFVRLLDTVVSPGELRRAVGELIENDFERVLGAFAPDVAQCLCAARAFPELRVGLTGSGSAFFGLPSSAQSLTGLMERLSSALGALGTRVLLCHLRTARP